MPSTIQPKKNIAGGCATEVQKLRDEAVEQNRRAKSSWGYERKVAYQRKANALSLLVLLGHVEVDSIELKGGRPVVGLTVTGNVRLHALSTDLTPAARDTVLKQLTTCWNGSVSARF